MVRIIILQIERDLRFLSMSSNFSIFKQHLNSVVGISNEGWQNLNSSLSIISYSEKTLFHSLGELCTDIFFLNSGIVRSYLIDKNGREYTWSIHSNEPTSKAKNLFVTDYASVIKNKESLFYFESLSKIELVAIPVKAMQDFYQSGEEGQRIGRILAEEAFYSLNQRTLSLLTLTAAERYQQLVEHAPSILSLVADHYIASYLGVTPQSLSRLKKN